VDVDSITLLPASRAEVFIPAGSEASAERYVLRTVGLFTGAPSPDPQGDTWPAINLAQVLVKPRSSGAAPALQPVTTISPRLALSQTGPTATAAPVVPDYGASTEVASNCLFLPTSTDGRQFRRRITFKQNTADFLIGSEIVDQDDSIVDLDGNPIKDAQPGSAPDLVKYPRDSRIEPTKFAMDHAGTHGFVGGRRICGVAGRPEVWELSNVSPELHNFHMHQVKFRLAVAGDPGLPKLPAVVPEASSPSAASTARAATVEGQTFLQVDAWHDTLPIYPSGWKFSETQPAAQQAGRTFVYIPFAAREQVGRFVFHCHILEHEDGGMMAPIEISPARTAEAAGQPHGSAQPTGHRH
jgi:hypothetical protein